MQKKAIFLSAFLALATLTGCQNINAGQQQAQQSGELPIAPVQPVYAHLSPTPPPLAPYEAEPQLADLQHQAWRPGYWTYEDGQFTWEPGKIIPKPSFTAVWVPDHWEKRAFGYVFVCGYWQ